MPKSYKYTGFGLNISSELAFPEMLEIDFDSPDLVLRLDRINDTDLPERNFDTSFSEFTDTVFFLHMKGIAKYHVREGRSVTIEPYPDADPAAVRAYFLSITMAAIMLQRQRILLHASAILHEGELILFAGDCGAGKSTLAAELYKRGYTLFSDDICVLVPGEKANDPVRAFASYPMMKLWGNSVDALEDDVFNKTHRILPHLDKYGQFFHENFVLESFPIRTICILEPEKNNDGPYSRAPLTGIEAFTRLGQHTYRKQYIYNPILQSIHLETLAYLTNRVKIVLVKRDPTNGSIPSFTDFVEETFSVH